MAHEKLAELSRFLQQFQHDQANIRGCLMGGEDTLDQSNPSTSIAIFAALKQITPSLIAGQVNWPDSNHLVTKTIPVPSQVIIFNRSRRLDRKMKTLPQ